MDNHPNPYQAPPPSTLPPEEEDLTSFLLPVEKCPLPGFVSAGRKRRLLNVIIDTVCITLIASLISFFFFPMNLHHPLNAVETIAIYMATYAFLLHSRYAIIFGAIFAVPYYVLLEMLTGRTLGKLITGTRVINEKGHRPTFVQTLIRTLIRFFPLEAFTFLGDTRGFHDSVGTWVVLNKPQPPEINAAPQ